MSVYIIAFTYEADLHCVECAVERFGKQVLHSSEGLADSEGNEPHPLFSTDEHDENVRCGTCGDLIGDIWE